MSVMYGRVMSVELGDKMKLPFPIRGTPGWDAREYQRYLLGSQVMSFGPLTPELNRYKTIKNRIRQELKKRDVNETEIEEYVNKRPKL